MNSACNLAFLIHMHSIHCAHSITVVSACRSSHASFRSAQLALVCFDCKQSNFCRPIQQARDVKAQLVLIGHSSAVQFAMPGVSCCCTPEVLLGQCAQSLWKNILVGICHLHMLLDSNPRQASLCSDSGRHCSPLQWHCRCTSPVLTHPPSPDCPENQ